MADKIAYHNMIINVATGIAVEAIITIFEQGTANLVTIYADKAGVAKSNPFVTDVKGRFDFYVGPGEYDIQVSGIGITTYKLEDVSIIGIYEEFITSDPQLGEYRLKKLRVGSSGNSIVVTRDGVAEV